MGLKCPKCGTDNLLTAVFCRGCHEKLDLSQMQPDVLVEDAKQKAKKKGMPAAVKWTLGILVALIVVLIAGALIPQKQISTGALKEQKELYKQYKRVRNAKRTGEAAFSSADITCIMNHVTDVANSAEQGALRCSSISVFLLSEKEVAVVLGGKAFGFLPVSLYACYQMNVGENGLAFVPVRARIGYVPLVAGTEKIAYSRMSALLKHNVSWKKICGHVTEVQMDDTSWKVKYGTKPKTEAQE